MKILTNIILAVVSLVLMGILGSCETLEDTYRVFTQEGETIYIGKADSIKTRGGRNRLELSWLLISDPKVTNYKVYWNNGEDSISGNVVKTDQVDTVRLLFNDMEENYFQFDIYMFDKAGNSSIRSSQIGRVFGENYERSLLNRTYSSLVRKGENLIVEWMAGESDLLGIQIQYQNALNETIEKMTPGDVTIDTLYNFPVGGSFEYKSMFLPEPLALDTFYTVPTTITFAN